MIMTCNIWTKFMNLEYTKIRDRHTPTVLTQTIFTPTYKHMKSSHVLTSIYNRKDLFVKHRCLQWQHTVYREILAPFLFSPILPSDLRVKGRDPTQSHDKSPYTDRKSKKQRDNTKTPPKTSITQRLRTDLGWSVGVTIATHLQLV